MIQNKKLIILIVLGTGAVFSLIYGIIAPSRPGRTLSRPEAVQKKEPGLTSREITPAKRQAKSTRYSFWGRSPFLPPEEPKEEIETVRFNLGGIVWHEESPKAIINNVLVGVGGKVGKYTVTEIKQDRVVLSDGANYFVVRLGE